jgi:CBS domain containing-hemolysin-like protein
MDDACSTWQLLAAAGLVSFSAFLVASQFAIARVRPARLRELADQGSRRAATALRITSPPDAYLSATQFGIILASIALGLVSASVANSVLAALWYESAISRVVTGAAVFVAAVFLHAVFGYLVPRSVAIQKAEGTALWLAMPLRAFCVVLSPAMWLFAQAARGVLRLMGLEAVSEERDLARTEEEVRAILSSCHEHGVIEEHEVVLVENVLDFTDRVAREIMTPRTDVSVLFTDQTLEEATEVVLAEGHTRYPLCRGDRDHVVGVVHIRDVFSEHCGGQNRPLESLARDPLVIPETLPLNQVQQKLQAGGTPMALVVDEYGAFAGILTFEDLVEEVFGEFRDEFDEAEPEMVRTTADGVEIDAGMLLEEAMDALGVDGELDVEGVDTLGGLVFSLLGDRPRVGDAVSIDSYRLVVAEVEGLRITRVKATPLPEEKTGNADRALAAS